MIDLLTIHQVTTIAEATYACDELSPSLLERIIRYAKQRQRNEQLLEQRVQARTAELQTALEELQVIEEELRIQLEATLHPGCDQIIQ